MLKVFDPNAFETAMLPRPCHTHTITTRARRCQTIPQVAEQLTLTLGCLLRTCRATRTEAKRLGSEVPAAVTVNPIKSSGTPSRQPAFSADSIMPSARSAKYNTEIIIVAG